MTPERKYLKQLVRDVAEYIRQVDALMVSEPPASAEQARERGRLQAQLINQLEFARDCAERFGLGVLKERKRKRRPA